MVLGYVYCNLYLKLSVKDCPFLGGEFYALINQFFPYRQESLY